jgi:hypothetical protein
MNVTSKYDTDLEKAGSELLNFETAVSTLDIRGPSLNNRQFCLIRLPSGGMMYAQKCFRQSVVFYFQSLSCLVFLDIFSSTLQAFLLPRLLLHISISASPGILFFFVSLSCFNAILFI